jgi:hypothetical protein
MTTVLRKPNAALNAKLFKLTLQQHDLLQERIERSEKPPQPIGEINHERVGIRTSFGNLRTLFLLPWLLGICLSLYWAVNDFYEAWKSTERAHLRFIEISKKKYGDDHFDKLRAYIERKTSDPAFEPDMYFNMDKAGLEMYDYIENGKMSFKTYFHYHYYETAYAERTRIGDIVLGSAIAIAIPTLLISILSFRRRAPLYFDRDRGIVYTWRKGRVWAQYYDHFIYYTSYVSMDTALFAFDKHNTFKIKIFVVTPSGNPFFNSEDAYRKVLAYITQFMTQGRDAVSDKDWIGRKGWYLFTDKKPADFDEQLHAVLTHIKTENINEQAESLAKEWGYLQPAQEAEEQTG